MSEQMVIKVSVGLEAQDFLADSSSEQQSLGSMSDSGEFSVSDGEVPLDHTECQLAMSYNPNSDSYRLG